MISKLSFVAAAILVTQNYVLAQGLPNVPSEIGYFDTDAYQAKTWSVKLNELWAEAQNQQTPEPQAERWNLDGLFKEDIKISFNKQGDEMPAGRVKFNHQQGVLAKVLWIDIGGHPYTGLYKGNSEGLFRMSEGNFNVAEAPGMTPTFGIKFPRTRMRSVNWVAGGFEPNDTSKTPAGTSPFDPFARNFCTSCNFFTGKNAQTVQRKFAEFTPFIGALGKSAFSRFTKDGWFIRDFKFPFNISFRPPAAIKGQIVHTLENPWYQQIKAINFPIGTVLFDVFAITEPAVTTIPNPFPGSQTIKIAEIRLNSEIITSSFGDKRLFFQHESMVVDHLAEPAWKDFTRRLDTTLPENQPWGNTPIPDFFPDDPTTQKAAVRGQLRDHECPFAWLLGYPISFIF